MELSPTGWFREMEVDDPTFIIQWDMRSPNQSALEGEGRQLQSSHPFFYSVGSPSSITFSSQSMDVPRLSSARKIQKSTNRGSCNTEIDTAPNLFTPILQFQCPVSPGRNIVGGEAKPKEKAVVIPHASELNGIELNGEQLMAVDMARPTHVQDHNIAERKRRERINQQFIELSSILPGLKKMDKATILCDAVNYVKGLEEKVKCLLSQNAKKNIESVILVKKSQVVVDYDNSSSDDNFDQGTTTSKPLPEVEVKIFDRSVLISILCENHKGMISKVLSAIEDRHLTITSANILPFTGSYLHFTIAAQAEKGFSMTVKDLARKLNSTFDQFK